MKYKTEKNTAPGTEVNLSDMKRRKLDIVGDKMPDPFFDSYQQEGIECCDIIDLIDRCDDDLVTVTFGKVFLRKIVRSHILFIKEIEKGLSCPRK